MNSSIISILNSSWVSQYSLIYLEIIENDWKPGMNTPFDPVASKKARDLGISVFVLKGTDLYNLKQAIKGQKFNGTIIS